MKSSVNIYCIIIYEILRSVSVITLYKDNFVSLIYRYSSDYCDLYQMFRRVLSNYRVSLISINASY